MKTFIFALFFALMCFAFSTASVQADDKWCDTCELVAGTIHHLIANNKSEEFIFNSLEKACSVMPAPYNDECTQVVEQYGFALIKNIIEKEDADAVCTQIGLCSYKNDKYTTVNPIKMDLSKLYKNKH